MIKLRTTVEGEEEEEEDHTLLSVIPNPIPNPIDNDLLDWLEI